jgi:hypothetical protein
MNKEAAWVLTPAASFVLIPDREPAGNHLTFCLVSFTNISPAMAAAGLL